ncbi:MAG: hypothetical protein LBT89_00065 [Planctomycetaceae bacterium]|jgi:bacterioferritin|nr:hypothetical protein [Planctomycetaceae bacterium]
MPSKEQIAKVVECLNTARSMELNAIVQYLNQHYGLDGDDYAKLAGEMKKIAIDEMRHAEAFAERIKDIDNALEPTAKLQPDTIKKGQEVEEIYPFDADAEERTIEQYGKFAAICRENNDYVSAVLFEKIIAVEQAHFNYFSDTGEHVRKLGNSFLAKQVDKE